MSDRLTRLRWVLVLGSLLGSASASAKDPVVAPEELVFCTVCHGVQLMGNPIIRAPRLSGLSSWYVEKQLHAFKDGWRGVHEADLVGMEMQPMAAALTDKQIKQAASFVVATDSPMPERTLDGNPSAGRALYATCSACHGNQAEGNEALGSPALAGLNDWYLREQLQKFQSGARGSHPADVTGQQMRAAMQVLGDETAIDDVVAYIAILSH